MEYHYDAELDNKDFIGHVVSGINLNVSRVFDDTLVLKFKLQIDNQSIRCVIPCNSRSNALKLKPQLKKSRLESNKLKIQAADLNGFYLIGGAVLITQHGRERLKLADDSLKITPDSDSDSDEKFDKDGRAGIVSNFAEHKDLNENVYFSFDFKLIPRWNADIDDSTKSCVMYSHDINVPTKAIQTNFHHSIKACHKQNKVLSLQVVGENSTLNIIGKPTVFRVTDYKFAFIPKSEIKKLFSQKIEHTNLHKNDLDLILRLNHDRYKLSAGKDGITLSLKQRADSYFHFSNTTVLILKALETEEKMDVAQTDNGNFFINISTIQYLLNSDPKHIPVSQTIREIQALIDNGVIKLVDQANIPKDFENNDN